MPTLSQKSKKKQKVILGFGQGRFVIRTDHEEVRDQIAFASECIRERHNNAMDEKAARVERRIKKRRRSRR